MYRSLSIVVGNDSIALFRITHDSCDEYYEFNTFGEFNTKFSEIIETYHDHINIYLDNEEQTLILDDLVSITNYGFEQLLKNRLLKESSANVLSGYFLCNKIAAGEFEKKVYIVKTEQSPLITQVLSLIKSVVNPISRIASMPVELQQLCAELKRVYVTIHYDHSELLARTYIEYDIYAFRTSSNMLRYLIFQNENFYSLKHIAFSKDTTEEAIVNLTINNIDKILKEIDPSINDQLNLFICGGDELSNKFEEFVTKVDRLIIVDINKASKDFDYVIKGENNKTIDQLALIFLNNRNIIANISDKEFENIIFTEKLNAALRWPTLILSILIVISFVTTTILDNRQASRIKLLTEQKNNFNQQIASLQRQFDILLSQNDAAKYYSIYKELSQYHTPFHVMNILSKLKSPNLEFHNIFWTNADLDNSNQNLFNQTIIIANIITDNKHSYASVINNFITQLMDLDSHLIVDYSSPTNTIIDVENNANNPIIIKIRSIEKK